MTGVCPHTLRAMATFAVAAVIVGANEVTVCRHS